MKNKIILYILLSLLSITKLNGQIFSKSPRNINQAIKILDKELSVQTKTDLINTASDSVLDLYKNSLDDFNVMDEWFFKRTRRSTTKDARLGKYFMRKGLEIPYDMIEVILRSYQFKLKGLQINHQNVLTPFQLRQKKNNEEDKNQFSADSLRGFYIPKDLDDCLKTLDKTYSDSIKIEIIKLSEDEYSSSNHLFGIGIWMRNNWQLWSGSRLSKYFNQMGIFHPESMSGIIMHCYYRYLKKEEINLDEQIKHYKILEKVKNDHGG